MLRIFYNRNGEPTCYTEDGEHIFSFRGDPLGYIYGELIYTYSGNHIGWYLDNWIRDLRGNCVFYTDISSGGPVKPTMHVAPVRSVKRIAPIKCTRHVPTVKPVKTYSWSYNSGIDFFR